MECLEQGVSLGCFQRPTNKLVGVNILEIVVIFFGSKYQLFKEKIRAMNVAGFEMKRLARKRVKNMFMPYWNCSSTLRKKRNTPTIKYSVLVYLLNTVLASTWKAMVW